MTLVHPGDATRRKHLPADAPFDELLLPVMRGGRRLVADPPLEEARTRTQKQLSGFHAGVKRFLNPHAYPAGLDLSLHELRTQLVLQARQHTEATAAARGQ